MPIHKNSPCLAAELNASLEQYGLGAAFGNTVEPGYLVNAKFAGSTTKVAERKTFLALVGCFRQYSDQYQLDDLLMAAQGYQESQLGQSAKSGAGAVGVMRLVPATSTNMKVGDITETEANIHAGVKYLRCMIGQYLNYEAMDGLNKGVFTFASYDVGTGRVRQSRRVEEKRGLDSKVWFGNVEQIASERVGRETVACAGNIYKYHVACKLVSVERDRREAAKAGMTPGVKQRRGGLRRPALWRG